MGTLVIYDRMKKVIVVDGTAGLGKRILNLFVDCLVEYYNERYFEIVYPDNTKETVIYTKNKMDEKHFDSYSSLWQVDPLYKDKDNLIGYIEHSKDTNHIEREQTLQQILNNLEEQGYIVPIDKMALFMNKKIDKLIIRK